MGLPAKKNTLQFVTVVIDGTIYDVPVGSYVRVNGKVEITQKPSPEILNIGDIIQNTSDKPVAVCNATKPKNIKVSFPKLGEVQKLILATIRDLGDGAGRARILTRLSLHEVSLPDWNSSRLRLKKAGLIEQIGDRKFAVYRLTEFGQSAL